MNLLQTIRFSLRQMRKRWVLTSAAAISLALCIGLNTAIFSVFNAVLLRSLPFPDPENVVEIYNTYPQGGLDKGSSNIELYTVYKEQVPAIEGYALTSGATLEFGADAGAERITAMRVSADFFENMGIMPMLGNPFQEENGNTGMDHVVLLTHGFWQSAFAGDPDVVGQDIELDGTLNQIIGVLPQSFRQFAPDAQVVTPFSWDPSEIDLSRRHLNYAMLLGRLANGSSIAEAQAQVDAVDAAYRVDNPQAAAFLERAGHRSRIGIHQEERVESIKPTIYLLNVFAISILIIGALNIANLRLAEVAGRERELTIRRAMGGSQRQLLAQLLIEAAVLGMIGGAIGLLTTYLSMDIIRDGFSTVVRNAESIQLDGSVLVWSLVLVLATILIVGLSPLRILRRLNFQTLLQEGGRGSASGRRTTLRLSLGIIQTALAVILLIATGLFVRSFWNATKVDPGFDAAKVDTFRIALPESRYPDATARVAMVKRVLAEMRTLPGVEKAAGSSALPVVTGMAFLTFSEFGDDPLAEGPQKAADNFFVTEDFFSTLGIPIQQGRALQETDSEEAPGVYVVDETMATRYLNDDPVGQRMTFGRAPENDDEWPTVVGTVPAIIQRDLTDLNEAPLVYRSYYQNPSRTISILLRNSRDQDSLLADARTAMARLDPGLPIYLTGNLGDMIENSLQERQAILILTIVFAIVALLLAIAGIYGVQAFNVQTELRSIAIRAAIGATPAMLLRRTLLRSLIPVAIGLLTGVIVTILFAPQLADLVFSIPVRDPLTISIVGFLVLLVSLTALFFPARLAARCNPASILHEE